MTDPNPGIETPLPEVSHVAFVVEDLEESMRRFGDLLGVEPWLVYRYEPPRLTDTTYRGEPVEYSMRVAMTDVKGPVDATTAVASGSTVKRLLGWFTSVRDRLGLGSSSGGGPGDGVVRSRGSPSPSLPTPGIPGVNVELIEPLRGPSTYTTHLAERGEGIHHVGCFAYDDPHAVVRGYEDAGVPIVQSGVFDGLEFWYLDMREALGGVILEVAANLGSIEEPDAVFPE
ncbi:VOC family protein [Halorubrum sp. F4]|uniref:VOC family protein n=1 Tax=Halorubrum sp. F4 TaxID=2989715 RepID=UPI0024807EB3|nr:VOC family protein [Halorubrum sp. F4]